VIFRADGLEAAGLTLDLNSITNDEPPQLDIKCSVEGTPYYFELDEIADAELAMNYSRSLKTFDITGGVFSQEMPLIEMIRKKTARSYETNGAPVDLVLYYDKQYPLRTVLD